jgi:hypothetical protein
LSFFSPCPQRLPRWRKRLSTARSSILSTMITLADRDPGTFSSAAADPSPQVRRPAVIRVIVSNQM